MLRGFSDGTFAIGLIVGIGLAIIFFLHIWPDGENEKLSEAVSYSETQSEATDQKNKDSDRSAWFHWDGRLVTSSDTLAQWVMTVFTIIAAALLLGTLFLTKDTLRVSQDMTRDSKKIGEAQTRAYLTVDFVKFTQFENGLLLEVKIRNVGSSPTKGAFAIARPFLLDTTFMDDPQIWKTRPEKIRLSDLHNGGEILAPIFFPKENDIFWRVMDESGFKPDFRSTVDLRWTDVFDRLHKCTVHVDGLPQRSEFPEDSNTIQHKKPSKTDYSDEQYLSEFSHGG